MNWVETITGTKRNVGLAILLMVAVSGIVAEVGSTSGEVAAVNDPSINWDDSHLDKNPVREIHGLVLERSNWTYDCMECHRSLTAKWHIGKQLMEHGNLKLNHGNNRFCLNCHHPKNLNAFVDYDGSEISEENGVLLCAKCHGPQHRDWVVGAHGRRNGYWNRDAGESDRLACIQCHDPHDPAFKAIKPLVGPTYPARAAGRPSPHSGKEKEADHHGE